MQRLIHYVRIIWRDVGHFYSVFQIFTVSGYWGLPVLVLPSLKKFIFINWKLDSFSFQLKIFNLILILLGTLIIIDATFFMKFSIPSPCLLIAFKILSIKTSNAVFVS